MHEEPYEDSPMWYHKPQPRRHPRQSAWPPCCQAGRSIPTTLRCSSFGSDHLPIPGAELFPFSGTHLLEQDQGSFRQDKSLLQEDEKDCAKFEGGHPGQVDAVPEVS